MAAVRWYQSLTIVGAQPETVSILLCQANGRQHLIGRVWIIDVDHKSRYSGPGLKGELSATTAEPGVPMPKEDDFVDGITVNSQ